MLPPPYHPETLFVARENAVLAPTTKVVIALSTMLFALSLIEVPSRSRVRRPGETHAALLFRTSQRVTYLVEACVPTMLP